MHTYTHTIALHLTFCFALSDSLCSAEWPKKTNKQKQLCAFWIFLSFSQQLVSRVSRRLIVNVRAKTM